MKRSRGVSTFVATLILVAISLTLSYVVYQGVRSFSSGGGAPTFENQVTLLQGTPDILRLAVNSSQQSTPLSLEAESASSQSGILYFDGSGYGATSSLCLPTATTFFSVYAASAGNIQITSDGRSWIDGQWATSLMVQPGWHEVMISDASSCDLTTPGAPAVAYPSKTVSGVPLVGASPSDSFTFYVPTDGSDDPLLIVFNGGYDQIAS